MTVKEKIISEYKNLLEDARDMWLSEYCCSARERDKRVEEDEMVLANFIELVNMLKEED